jgi:hypothetical protein
MRSVSRRLAIFDLVGARCHQRGADLGGENQMALLPSLAWPAHVKLVAQERGRWDIGAFRHRP